MWQEAVRNLFHPWNSYLPNDSVHDFLEITISRTYYSTSIFVKNEFASIHIKNDYLFWSWILHLLELIMLCIACWSRLPDRPWETVKMNIHNIWIFNVIYE
jgi:hypothetical protein